MDRLCKISDNGFMEFYKREVGFSSPRSFSRHISASESLVKQIELYGKLIGHEGCVNTVEFNSTGDHLVSGSDDRQIMFWEWATKTLKFSYPSGHLDNVFQAKIMPLTDDRKIVTSSADGKYDLRSNSGTKLFHCSAFSENRQSSNSISLNAIVIDPSNPHYFAVGGSDEYGRLYDIRKYQLDCSSSVDSL